MSARPLVSVGVPAFNAAESLPAALEGILGQSYENLEVLVSDNASSDETAQVANDFAASDSRVRVIQQTRNLGAQVNFRYLLSIAKGPCFMWAGSDDVHQPEFVASNLERLLHDPTLSGCVSQVRWLRNGIPADLAAGTVPLLGTPRDNLATYMRSARDNSRFYGLFRRDALLPSFPERPFHGFDIAVMAGTLRFGGHDRVDRVLLQRRRRDPAEYTADIRQVNGPFVDRLIPLRRLTGEILAQNRQTMSVRALWWLTWRNFYEHSRYWASTDGPYGSVSRLLRDVLDTVRHRVWAKEDSQAS